MGTTGSSAAIGMNSALPEIVSRVKRHTQVPLAVGFGVATREHFDIVANAGADGIVIGSRFVSIIKHSPPDQIAEKIEAYCRELTVKGESADVHPAVNGSKQHTLPQYTKHGRPPSAPTILPARFGQYGGQYVPEALFDCLVELEEAHKSAISDPDFWKEYRDLFGYMNRPSKLYFAENLTKHIGGAKIWFKREDLCETSSHSEMQGFD